MVGHATVRRAVMGDDYKRPARDDEIARMQTLVDQGMREGAVGLSSGLEYEVGSYSTTPGADRAGEGCRDGTAAST